MNAHQRDDGRRRYVDEPPTAMEIALAEVYKKHARKDEQAFLDRIGYDKSPPTCKSCHHISYRMVLTTRIHLCLKHDIDVQKGAICDHWIDVNTKLPAA